MKVILLQHTQDPERVVAQAAKLCYSASGVEAIAGKLTPEKTAEFIRMLASAGHVSAFEHASFTFAIEGVSRVLTHQLVRHRLASFSQQSQRYVKLREFPYVTPSTIAATPALKAKFDGLLQQVGKVYAELLDAGVPAEDARYVLPNACETKIVVTMNARELLHFFNLRCCRRAQWEIRNLATEMLRQVKPAAPNIFRQAGPGCVQGECPESPKFACNDIAEVRDEFERL